MIAFAWGTSGPEAGRVTSINDAPGDTLNDRKVQYQYSSGGLLWKATTSGGKTTEYGYGAAAYPANKWGTTPSPRRPAPP